MDSDAKAEIAARLLAFAEQTNDFVGITDPWGRIIYLNPAARKRLGHGGDAVDLTTANIFPPEAFAIYYDVARPELLRTGTWSGEYPVNVAGAGVVTIRVSLTARIGPGGEINEIVMVGHDVAPHEISVSDDQHIDQLAAVLPRADFEERAQLVLAAAARSGESCALVLARVSDAVTGDETLQPPTAEMVMRALAGRIRRFARTTDVVGRFGERGLGVLVRGVSTRNEALRIGRTVQELLLDPPVTTPGEAIALAVGCGVGFAAPGTDLRQLIEAASAIRWREQATAGAPPVDTSALGEHAEIATLDEFRIGLSLGEVRSYAQPVVDMGSGRVVGYQGLARWHHRWLGPLDAAVFAGMIADTALANQVDLYVARETAAVLALRARDVPLRLYAPVARRLVADVRTEQYLSEIVDAFALDMSQIRLQLAPGLVPEPGSALLDALGALRDAGVTLVATGIDRVADVAGLADLGFGELQLSRHLVRATATDPDPRDGVAEIVRIAHGRGVAVAAAGVGEPDQRDAIRDAGCDLAIGDLFGEPELAGSID